MLPAGLSGRRPLLSFVVGRHDDDARGDEEKLVQKAAGDVAARVVGGVSACKSSLGPVDVSIRFEPRSRPACTRMRWCVRVRWVTCSREDDSAVGRWAADRFEAGRVGGVWW